MVEIYHTIWLPAFDVHVAAAWQEATDKCFGGDDHLAALSIADRIRTRRLVPGMCCFNPPVFDNPDMNDTRDLWPWSAAPPNVGLVELQAAIKEGLIADGADADYRGAADYRLMEFLAVRAQGPECGTAFSIFNVVQWNFEYPGAAFPAPAPSSVPIHPDDVEADVTGPETRKAVALMDTLHRERMLTAYTTRKLAKMAGVSETIWNDAKKHRPDYWPVPRHRGR